MSKALSIFKGLRLGQDWTLLDYRQAVTFDGVFLFIAHNPTKTLKAAAISRLEVIGLKDKKEALEFLLDKLKKAGTVWREK